MFDEIKKDCAAAIAERASTEFASVHWPTEDELADLIEIIKKVSSSVIDEAFKPLVKL